MNTLNKENTCVFDSLFSSPTGNISQHVVEIRVHLNTNKLKGIYLILSAKIYNLILNNDFRLSSQSG